MYVVNEALSLVGAGPSVVVAHRTLGAVPCRPKAVTGAHPLNMGGVATKLPR